MKQVAQNKKIALAIFAVVSVMTVIFLSAPNAFAQEKRPQPKQYQIPPQTPNEQPTTNSTLVISPNEDYLIGPSDVIEIKVEDAPEVSGIYRLNSNGTFTLPIVGQVAAKAKRTEEVQAMIAEKLRGGYLINPIVTVLVRQSNSRAFFIQGAVRRPGIYQIEGRPSLLKLITIAGGLADNYGSTAFVLREKPVTKDVPLGLTVNAGDSENQATTENADDSKNADGSDKYELVQANINNLLRGNLEQNVMIEPGDIVHIPQTDVFFVAGEVKAPGSFPLKDGTTLRQAISLAQGTTFEGATDRGVIFREDRNGKRQEIAVNIKEVMAGKRDDVDILPNDIIIVPNSKKKAVTKSLLNTLGGTVPGLLLRSVGVF